MMGRGVPGSEARKVRTWLGRPTASIMGQTVHVYRLTPSGPVVLKAKEKPTPEQVKAGEMRSITSGTLLGIVTQLTFDRIQVP